MPCGGPDKNAAFKVGAEFTVEVLALLKERHNIRREGLALDSSRSEWDKQQQKLLEALQEMVWIDHAEY